MFALASIKQLAAVRSFVFISAVCNCMALDDGERSGARLRHHFNWCEEHGGLSVSSRSTAPYLSWKSYSVKPCSALCRNSTRHGTRVPHWWTQSALPICLLVPVSPTRASLICFPWEKNRSLRKSPKYPTFLARFFHTAGLFDCNEIGEGWVNRTEREGTIHPRLGSTGPLIPRSLPSPCVVIPILLPWHR